MTRLLFTATAFALIVPVSAAEAQVCTCVAGGDGSLTSEGPDWSIALVDEAPEVTVELAFSSDGSHLESALAPARPVPPQRIAWCADRDDPRCAPVDPQRDPNVRIGRAPPGASADRSADDVPAPSAEGRLRAGPAGGPRAGYSRLPERPPTA